MIKKTLTFENHLGQKETEDFYFNMSKGELTVLQMAAINNRVESFQDKIEKIGKATNGRELADVLDDLIVKTVGEKSTDGKQFIKNDEIRDRFKFCGAWDELIVELCSSEDRMAEFVNGLMPKNLREDVKKTVAQQQEDVRARSLAQKGGFNQKQEPKSTVTVVPELPTVIEQTAEPVLQTESESSFDEDEKLAFEQWKAAQKQPSTTV